MLLINNYHPEPQAKGLGFGLGNMRFFDPLRSEGRLGSKDLAKRGAWQFIILVGGGHPLKQHDL